MSGRLLVTSQLKITDNDNAAETPEPATTQEQPFQFPVQCAATADTSRGGQCIVTTSYDALIPSDVSFREGSGRGGDGGRGEDGLEVQLEVVHHLLRRDRAAQQSRQAGDARVADAARHDRVEAGEVGRRR